METPYGSFHLPAMLHTVGVMAVADDEVAERPLSTRPCRCYLAPARSVKGQLRRFGGGPVNVGSWHQA